MNQLEQLKRDGNLLAKPVRPKKPKKGLRRASPKRAQQMKEYLKLRGAFLRAHPYCQAWNRVHGWEMDNGGLSFYHGRSTEIHHVAGRGKNLLNTSTWLAVSRRCHNWIHAHPKEARELGLLQ